MTVSLVRERGAGLYGPKLKRIFGFETDYTRRLKWGGGEEQTIWFRGGLRPSEVLL